MTNLNKICGLLGFSARAGKVLFGTDSVIEAVEYNKVKLVIVTEDASEKTKKNIQFICNKNKVKCLIFGTKDELSHAIGKVNKVVFAVKDKNLANEIERIIIGGDAV